MPGTRCLGRAVGSTVDPKIACLNKRLLRLSQGGSLVPEGTESVPKDDMPGDCVTLIRRLTAVRTVVCSPKRARWFAVGQPRTGSLSPGREAELGPGGLARAEDRSRPRPLLEATSATTDQVALEALGLLQLAGYPKIPRAETAPGWTTWKRCLSSGQTRRSGRSTPEVTLRHYDQCAFSTLPGEHPIGSLRWPLGSSRYVPRVKLGEPPHEWGACLRRGRVYPCRRSGSPPEGG
jgi:hypothetical protein